MKKLKKFVGFLLVLTIVLNVLPVNMLAAAEAWQPVSQFDGWYQIDIGAKKSESKVSYDEASGALTLQADGGDIWGTQDNMLYVFTQVNGDKDFIARIKGPTKEMEWSKAGLYIRENLEPDSRNMAVVVPGDKEMNGIRAPYRQETGAESFDFMLSGARYAGEYTWIRVMRQGIKFTSFVSVDGETWDKVGSVKMFDVPDTYFIGFGAASNADTQTTAVFDQITIRESEEDTTFSGATLSELRVNGIRIADFDPEQTEYHYVLPSRHRSSSMPAVEFKTHNDFATTQVERDNSIPGKVTVHVTAEDGVTTQSYTIHFTKSEEPEKISSTTSWVGNTFSGNGTVQDGQWVQNKIEGMIVLPDGTCYTESEYDEAGRTHGIYKDGQCIGNKNMDIDATRVTGGAENATWYIQGNEILKAGTDIRITDVGKPAALAFANDGTLMIADNARYQVLFYDVTANPPVEVKAFGEKGGVVSETEGLLAGQIYPTRFWNLTGVGMDAAGNIYVSMSYRQHACAIRCLTPDGALVWKVESTAFVDSFDFDPTTDGKDIYGLTEHYKMDYSKAEPGTQQELYAYTLDADKYPNDPRNLLSANYLASVWIEYIQGEKFMFATGMFANSLFVWRFEEEIAVPAAIIFNKHNHEDEARLIPNQPAGTGTMIWTDSNGDGDFQSEEFVLFGSLRDTGGYGWDVDKDGNVWRNFGGNRVAQFQVNGLDAHGNPCYSEEQVVLYDLPGYWNDVLRVQYDVDTDSLYVSGFHQDDPYEGHLWGSVGRVIYRYDGIKTGEMTVHENYPIQVPYYVYPSESAAPQFNINPKAFHMEADRLFLTYVSRGPLGYKTGEMHVYDTNTAQELGCVTPEAVVGGYTNVGWVDIPQAIKALKTSDGNYKVLVEEDYKAKQLLYTVTPYNGRPVMDGEMEIGDGFTIKSQAIDVPPVIDGVLNEHVWTTQGLLQNQTASELSENIITFGTGWDETYLYIGVNAHDDHVYGTAFDNHWDNDAIEIYIDGNNDKGGAYDEHDVQYIVAVGKDTLFASGSGMDAGVLWALAENETGYAVEVAVPWSILKLTPYRGMTVGFDVSNDDRMKEYGLREGSIMWAGDGGNFQSTEKFGVLILEDDTYHAPYTSGSITVDGAFDEEAWEIDRKMKTQTAGEIDPSETFFGVLWDENYLYIATRTKDDKVFGQTYADHWENDAMEIFIDSNNDKGGSYDEHDVQYIVAYKKSTIFSSGSGMDEGVIWTIVRTEDGYNVEVAVPWSTLKTEPEAGMVIGFDVSHDDCWSDFTGRTGNQVWAGDGGNFQSTENFGYAVLEKAE